MRKKYAAARDAGKTIPDAGVPNGAHRAALLTENRQPGAQTLLGEYEKL